ncbi:MAG: hypothetical protein OXC29_19355, partial [Rhodococcus sp.]|nr:hypothetical protein [Rhodococcus sp. (in: high G+C Gram-positive bacteria)]
MAPATPTGLMVSETSQTSITWTWEASEGALGYAVQVSHDETFDDTDQIALTTETSFTAPDIAPRTSLYLRVAAGTGTPEALAAAVTMGDLSGLALSAWTTHVTGMSAMPPPPPPPPAPEPVSVTFTPPEGKFPMVPDDDHIEATAMAQVNTKMTVMSNTTAVVVPMNFMMDATPSPLKLHEGENMPFQYVDWKALQSLVVTDGATFKIMRVTVGANQEEEPTGDVTYWTCGPFECAEGMDAPEISIANSAACAAWDPEVTLQVGYVDNTVVAADAATTTADILNDGVDIGWVYTSTEAMSVEHHFEGVTAGTNFSASSPDLAKVSADTPIPLVVGGTASDERKVDYAERYNSAILFDLTDAGAADDTANGSSACASIETYNGSVTPLHRPRGCFRISTADKDNDAKTPDANYFGGYSLELTPKAADVGWGSKVQWEEDPFEDEDLECESKTYNASEMVDICDLFETEVDEALADPWGGSKGTSVTAVVLNGRDAATDDVNTKLEWLEIAAPASASSRRFQTLWFSNNDGGMNLADTDIYADTDTGTTATERAPLLLKVVDGDDDPKFGDFGKVDLVAVGA